MENDFLRAQKICDLFFEELDGKILRVVLFFFINDVDGLKNWGDAENVAKNSICLREFSVSKLTFLYSFF